jgi:hypothetical protein
MRTEEGFWPNLRALADDLDSLPPYQRPEGLADSLQELSPASQRKALANLERMISVLGELDRPCAKAPPE